MKPILLSLAAVLLSLIAFSQEISGTVRDSTGAAIPYAYVNLRKQPGDVIAVFTTADAKGVYKLSLPASEKLDSLYLEARCIGYKTQIRPIAGTTRTIDFMLAVSASQLQSVVIKSNKPRLRTHGDTLSYKAADFTEAQDRVIGDVLKRLPGIAVAEDGTISYNNKPISGIYLGGDNLLGDKYSIATNTIPHSVVDQVQVIQNHQPIRVLENKVTSEAVALNLTFRPDAKMRVLGQETVGGGVPGNYYANLNALLLKDKFKALDYIKGNNTGEDLQQELASHNSGDDQLGMADRPPSALLSLGTVNNPSIARQRYFFDRSGLLNLNNLMNWGDGLQLRLNAWYLRDAQRQEYSQQTSVYLPGDTVQYTSAQHNRFNPNLWHAQVTMTSNREKQYLTDAALLESSSWQRFSQLNTNGILSDQSSLDNLLRFSNEFRLIRPIGKDHLIEGYSYVSHQSEPENRTIGPDYYPSVFNDGAGYAQLIQRVNVPTWYTNNYLSYKIPGEQVTKSFFAGFNLQSQQLTSDLSVQQTDKTINPALDSSLNRMSWHKSKIYTEAALDIPGERLKARLTLPLILQQIGYSDKGFSLDKSLNRMYINPQLYLKYMTSAENFITGQLSYRNQTGGIEDLYQGYILKDYRTLYANSADLTLRQNLSAAMGFNYRRSLRLLFASINLSYNRTGANTIASGVITNDFQQLIVLPYANSTGTWTADATVSKYSFKLRTTVDGELRWQNNRSVQIQNGAFLPFNTTVTTLVTGVSTKLSSRINFSYHVTGTETHSRGAADVASVRVRQLKQQGEVYYTPVTGLQLKLSGEHYFTHSMSSPDLRCFFADASVKKHFARARLDLELNAANILDVKTYRTLYLSANAYTSSSYTLPGRIILLKLMFSF